MIEASCQVSDWMHWPGYLIGTHFTASRLNQVDALLQPVTAIDWGESASLTAGTGMLIDRGSASPRT